MSVFRLVGLSLLLGLCGVHSEEPRVFLDNGTLRIGIDLSSGGSVCFFGRSGEGGGNVLNAYDRGRYVQQSYYGNADGSVWAGKPWRWNPIQGGNYEGEGGKVLEVDRKPGLLRVVSVPRNWAGGELLQTCRMEETLRLDGDVAQLSYVFRYHGKESHGVHDQEMPAVFVDAALKTMVFEHGGELRRVVPGWPNERHENDGEWVAYVGEDEKGIGVFTPGTRVMTAYRFAGDPRVEGSACSYVAPLRRFAVTPGLVVEFYVYLTLGSVEDIRERFAKIRARLAEEE